MVQLLVWLLSWGLEALNRHPIAELQKVHPPALDGRGMLRIVRILSFAAVAAAVWLSALQLDLPPARRTAVLLVRCRIVPLHCALLCTPLTPYTVSKQPLSTLAGL